MRKESFFSIPFLGVVIVFLVIFIFAFSDLPANSIELMQKGITKDINVDISAYEEPRGTLFLIDQNTPNNIRVKESKSVVRINSFKDLKFIGAEAYQNAVYSSTNPSVCVVDNSGLITPVSEGVAKIVADVDGDITETKVAVVSIDTNHCQIVTQDHEEVGKVYVGDEIDLAFLGAKEWASAKRKEAYFDSSDDSVLLCTDPSKGEFMALRPGKARVSVAVVCDGTVVRAGELEITIRK